MNIRELLATALASICLVALINSAAWSQEANGDAVAEALSFGDVVEITPDARLVVGREIDLEKGEIDVANALLYKTDTTLVVVDTGGTAPFVQSLDNAADQLRPFDEVVLISTHGHADHVGNNAWIDTLGVPATHYISAHDLAIMRDQVAYFTTSLGRVFAENIVALFGGLDTAAENVRVVESLPLEAIAIGGTAWDGWSLIDGAVLVLRTSSHTTGHVAVYLPGSKLLHLGDETTGYYQAFADGGPAAMAANLLTLQRAANAVRNGAVDFVTDGHSFKVHSGDEAAAYLSALVDGAIAYDRAVTRILNDNPGGIAVADLVAEIAKAPELADAPGGATNPYSYLQIANKLDELGIVQPINPSGAVAFPE